MKLVKNAIEDFKFKNTFEIYKNDLKEIKTNWVMSVIIVALCILPSFYAWFNIAASWDPYGSTGNMKIAVVNEDAGARLFSQDINVGDEIIKELEGNDKFDWMFVERDTAIENTNAGKYYAYIIIPENFSTDITSVVTKTVKPATLEYAVNEKINAIAPKITDKGADSIQLSITQTFDETVTKILFTTVGLADMGLDGQMPKLELIYKSMKSFRKALDNIDKDLNSLKTEGELAYKAIDGKRKELAKTKTKLNEAKLISQDVKGAFDKANGFINNIPNIIKTDMTTMSTLSKSLIALIQDLSIAQGGVNQGAITIIDTAYDKFNAINDINNSILRLLRSLNSYTDLNLLAGPIERHEKIKTTIGQLRSAISTLRIAASSGSTNIQNALNTVSGFALDLDTQISAITDDIAGMLPDPIGKALAHSSSISNATVGTLDKADKVYPQIDALLVQMGKLTGKADDRITEIEKSLPAIKQLTDLSIRDLDLLLNSEQLKSLRGVMKFDIVKRAEFFKQPVQIEKTRLYPVDNYGTAMSPFYSVLACWVGVVLLSALISTESKEKKYTSAEVFFGRGWTFLTLSVLQGTIISLGDLIILGIPVKHPVMFVLILMLSSMTFCYIIYSLVSVFANIGKAISILLLVVQIGGSGGTFPIEVTPRFFRLLHPAIPFTYCISACRETIAGIYYPTLVKDIIAMFTFMTLFIVFNVFLKAPINRKSEGFRRAFDESPLSEKSTD